MRVSTKLSKLSHLLILVSYLIFLKADIFAQSVAIPELVTPVYKKIKNLYSDIPLVANSKPVSAIVSAEQYGNAAQALQAVIEKRTGIRIPIVTDSSAGAATPFVQNLIILGNRSTSKTSSELYDRYYSLMDLKYPGHHGYSIRSLHNPYGNGFSAILVGGSDSIGVEAGAQAFVSVLDTLPARPGNLNAGWTMLTRLGDGVKIPTDVRNFETWEASRGYGSIGYFGWNSISKRMAMYYMTGDIFSAREVLRLSFPDAQALKEIDEIDGERIENKNDPLAGPYHYNAMMLILYWDLIEESPVFSDAERLKVTNAFARRFEHKGTTPYDKDTYKLNSVPASVGSRHGQWSALSVYTLARYFSKYYPSPMWAQAERAGKLYFASLHNNAYVVGEQDYLPWYATGIAPVLTYMILTGDRVPLENGVLQRLLHGQEVLLSGTNSDRMLNSAALDYLNKAACLTQDGRWITYRKRTGLNTDIFRLGQSFWPDENIKPVQPIDLADKWSINPMPEPLWRKQNGNIKLEQSFTDMSYRSAPDSSGDFILLDGHNGAYRNPYHTFDILNLRISGSTLLSGYFNQVQTSADGMVEPKVAMNAGVLYHNVLGQMATAVAEVPDLPYTKWKRTLMLCKGRYALIADDIGFRTSSDNVLVETTWEAPGATWMPKKNFLEIHPQGYSSSIFELHSSELMDVNAGKTTAMRWRGVGHEGQNRVFFHLIGQRVSGNNKSLSSLKLADNTAVFTLPETAIGVVGKYRNLQGDMVFLSEKMLYGHALRTAGLSELLIHADVPIEINWDFAGGKLIVNNDQPINLSIALISSRIVLNTTTITGNKSSDGLYTFNLPAGKNEIDEAFPPLQLIKILKVQLQVELKKADQLRSRQIARSTIVNRKIIPSFNPVMEAKLDGKPIPGIIIPSAQGDMLGIATDSTVTIINQEGKDVRKFSTPGEIRVLRWWSEPKLLLVGCADEKVIAFDEQGKKKWEFTSVMDPAVYEAGKPYWFKSRYPGIYGLYTGYFDNGKSRAFVGSACTLEILDEKGQLVKRIPVFWGNPRQFLIVNASDGSKNLLVGRYQNGFNNLSIINSKELKVIGQGYLQVPSGYTYVNGWSAMNRFDNFLVDLYGDGRHEVVSAINGAWNRISIYSEDGKPLYNAQFGPGLSDQPRSTIRMMDVGNITGDEKSEIIVGVASGLVVVLDGQAKKLWSKELSSPPTVVKVIKDNRMNWLCVGSENGTITAMDGNGNIIRQGKMSGRPVDLQVVQTADGPLVIVITDIGGVNGFKID